MPAPPDPMAFTIPGLNRPVYWYGLLVTLGTLVGAFVADRQARKRGHNPDHVWNALILVMVFGLIGARLYHVLSTPAGGATSLSYYLAQPREIVSFWNGGLRGLGIAGAMVGGILAILVYSKFAKLRFAEWLDLAALGLPLGQAIGRWGNYFNQELYGYPTNLPWGVPIQTQYRLPVFADQPLDARFHPTFLYESLWCLLLFFVLAYLNRAWRDRLVHGDIAMLYLILYAGGRYVIELQRPDAWMVAGLPAAQLLAVVTVAVAALVVLWRHGLFQRGVEPAEPADMPLEA